MIQKFGLERISWICGGDFNEFLWVHKKSRGAEVRHNRPRYLEEFMEKVEVLDLESNGQKFTWRGTQNGQLVEARLDRGLVNEAWLSQLPNSLIKNGMTLGSDHSPVLVQYELNLGRTKKLFRFEAFWAKDGECQDIVKGAWELNSEGNSLQQWIAKILDCRNSLSRWSKVKFKQKRWQINDMMDRLGWL